MIQSQSRRFTQGTMLILNNRHVGTVLEYSTKSYFAAMLTT